jgi:hypothetical protein
LYVSDQIDEKTEISVLSLAVQNGRLDIVEVLIKANADLNVLDPHGLLVLE